MSCEHDMANGTCSQCDPFVVQNLRMQYEACDQERIKYSTEIANLKTELDETTQAFWKGEKMLEASETQRKMFEDRAVRAEALWWRCHTVFSKVLADMTRDVSHVRCHCMVQDEPHPFGAPGCRHHQHHCDSCHARGLCSKEGCDSSRDFRLARQKGQDIVEKTMRQYTCHVCKDTHKMGPYEDSPAVMCTHCPVPCQECRAGGVGAFCTKTPCECRCHMVERKVRSTQ